MEELLNMMTFDVNTSFMHPGHLSLGCPRLLVMSGLTPRIFFMRCIDINCLFTQKLVFNFSSTHLRFAERYQYHRHIPEAQ